MMFLRLVCFLVAAFALAGPAAAEWHEARSKHFVIYSDGSLAQTRQFAVKVETFDRAVRVVRRMDDPPLGDRGRLTIYVLKNADAVARIYGNPKSNVAGFYLGRATGSVAFVHRDRMLGAPLEYRKFIMDPATVFFHEYFHHMMLSESHVALPRWVVEGFAEFFSTATIEDDGSLTFGRAANHRSTGLFSKPDFTIEELLGDSLGKLTDQGVHELYGRAWLLTHYLYSASARRGQLDRYLDGIQKGMPLIEAAREAFGDLQQLDQELDKYLYSKSLTSYVLSPEQIGIGPVQVRAMSAAESEMMPIRIRSDRGVDQKSAPEVAKQARAVGRKHLGNAFVQGTLAEAEYDVGEFAAAIAAADRALAVDPKNVQALIYKGRALMAQARADPEAADWKEVRGWFVRANRLEPEYAEPLMLYYQSFAAEGVQAPDTAVEGLLYAMLLAPGDEGLRMGAVVELIQRERLPEARAAFVPIAYNPHLNAEWRERNAKIMESLAAGKGSEAMALITAPAQDQVAAK